MKPSYFAILGVVACLVVQACSGSSSSSDAAGTGSDGPGAPNGSDATPPGSSGDPDASGNPPDGGSSASALPFTCAATTATPAPSACPAPSGASGMVSFCFRPQWAGVTGVDVYGGFGQGTDWSTPFVTLTNDGTGTFKATTALANGSYPYLYRVHGSADGLVHDGQYLLDQENPSFVPPPADAPLQRSVSQVTVPQVAAPLHHLKGKVVFAGVPQPCYSVDLEAGELYKAGGTLPLSEHTTANFAESAADGTFDFPVASGPLGIVVRFPFKLGGADAGYPDPASTPSVGIARANVDVTTADVVLDPADVAYPAAEYAKMAPISGTSSLPVTFTFSIIPGSTAAYAAVIATNIAGNDPAYASKAGTDTSVTWDGTFGGKGGQAKTGTTYYWGSWQKSAPGPAGTIWTMESLLYPITFQ